jgi:hypothetical protein
MVRHDASSALSGDCAKAGAEVAPLAGNATMTARQPPRAAVIARFIEGIPKGLATFSIPQQDRKPTAIEKLLFPVG